MVPILLGAQRPPQFSMSRAGPGQLAKPSASARSRLPPQRLVAKLRHRALVGLGVGLAASRPRPPARAARFGFSCGDGAGSGANESAFCESWTWELGSLARATGASGPYQSSGQSCSPADRVASEVAGLGAAINKADEPTPRTMAAAFEATANQRRRAVRAHDLGPTAARNSTPPARAAVTGVPPSQTDELGIGHSSAATGRWGASPARGERKEGEALAGREGAARSQNLLVRREIHRLSEDIIPRPRRMSMRRARNLVRLRHFPDPTQRRLSRTSERAQRFHSRHPQE